MMRLHVVLGFVIAFASVLSVDGKNCSNCNFYQCYEDKMHCGPEGYLIGYGKKYCSRFDTTLRLFNSAGKKWVSCVRQCLIDFLKPSYNSYPNGSFKNNCNALKEAAFNSHVDCYVKCGFCEICRTNKWALYSTYTLSDFIPSIARQQVEDTMKICGGYLSCF